MSCHDCEKAIDETGETYPYRWAYATVIVMGCKEHVRQIFEALNAAQEIE